MGRWTPQGQWSQRFPEALQFLRVCQLSAVHFSRQQPPGPKGIPEMGIMPQHTLPA